MSDNFVMNYDQPDQMIVPRPPGLLEWEASYDFERCPRPMVSENSFSPGDTENTTFQVKHTSWRPYNLPEAGRRFSHSPAFDNVCIACEDTEIRRLLTTGHGRNHSLGWFNDMANCRSCDLCRLIVHDLGQKLNPDLFQLMCQDRVAFVVLNSFSVVVPLPAHPRDRALELRAFLIDARQRNLCAETRIRVLSDSAPLLRKRPMFHGRVVDASHADLGMAKSWLAECCTKHACETRRIGATMMNRSAKPKSISEVLQSDDEWEESGEVAPEVYTGPSESLDALRVVDLELECLMMVPCTARYVALSYAWPRFETLRLLQGNTAELHQVGGLRKSWSKLPKVIQNAMTVVRGLGERHLWVDALCIIQDDESEKGMLIQAMDQVYGGSLLTLVVATAVPTTENYGIPGIDETIRSRTQAVGEMEGLRIATALLEYPESIKGSVWVSRGWTFQEAILSKRCLMFTDDQMYFRCGRDARSEDVLAEGCEPSNGHAARPGIHIRQLDYLISEVFLKNTSTKKAFTEYASLVNGFTGRNFTYSGDMLNAFTGVMQALSPHIPHPQYFLLGMPHGLFDQAILWFPSGPLRQIEELETKSVVMTGLPSWSWTSWEGKIGYERSNVEVDAERTFPIVQWWQFHGRGLMSLRKYKPSSTTEEKNRHDLLLSMSKKMRIGQLVFWGSCIKLLVGSEEGHIMEWLVDHDQTLPCFTLLDGDGDACGILPSADRDWAQRHKSQGEPRTYEFLLLSYAAPSRLDTIRARARFFHPKFDMLRNAGNDKMYSVFYNIMLIEYDDDGIAYRRGIGRVHVDTVNRQLEKVVPKLMILG
ncbi:hypothetical protein E8E14_014395 [Neopestalotiopsis sp. 37M]|nr:hypothetical protein E8E14_014395 [Neopestalotiopsis sp. 37M]